MSQTQTVEWFQAVDSTRQSRVWPQSVLNDGASHSFEQIKKVSESKQTSMESTEAENILLESTTLCIYLRFVNKRRDINTTRVLCSGTTRKTCFMLQWKGPAGGSPPLIYSRTVALISAAGLLSVPALQHTRTNWQFLHAKKGRTECVTSARFTTGDL